MFLDIKPFRFTSKQSEHVHTREMYKHCHVSFYARSIYFCEYGERKNGRASSSREEHEERFYDEKGDGGYKFKLEN